MTKKRFYQLLDETISLAEHPGRFQIHEVWDKRRIRVLKTLLILIFKNGDELCVDRRYPAHLMGEQYEAKMTLESLQKKYQRWYDKWLAKKGEKVD